MKVRLVSSIVIVCCVACPWQWLAAEEEIKYPSPNGRFALRITQPKDDEYHPTVELIEKDSGKLILMLHDGSDTDLFDPSECVLVWSADSKRLAYGFRANPPGARVEERSALICFGTARVSTKCFCRKICRHRGSSFLKEKRET